MRVVIDTNVVVSALFFGGLPDKLLGLALGGKIQAVASAEIISEYLETYQELAQKTTRRAMGKVLSEVLEPMEIISPKSKIEICRDPDDNKFINCAVDGKCKYIVSGDKDLLTIKSYKGVKIISVREFIDKN